MMYQKTRPLDYRLTTACQQAALTAYYQAALTAYYQAAHRLLPSGYRLLSHRLHHVGISGCQAAYKRKKALRLSGKRSAYSPLDSRLISKRCL